MARRFWRLGALLLTAMAVGPAFAADPPATQTASIAASPDALLAALSKPGWRDRRDAIHVLCARGPDAEAMVRQLLQRDLDKEQRKNVELALQMIRDNRLLGASLITLHLKNATAADTMQALSQQAGGDVPCDPSDLWSQRTSPTVTIDVDHQPYWDVMRTLSARLNVNFINESQELQFSRTGGGSPRVADGISTDGAFIFGANAYTNRRSMVVEILAVGEPKAPVIRTLDLTIQRGVDDQGNELMSQSGRGGMGRRGGRFGFGGGGRWGAPAREGPRIVNVVFQHPQEGVLRVAELSGQITISVQSGASTWEIDDPTNISPATRTVDSIPITIHSVRGGGDSYELRASIPFGSSDIRSAADEVVDLMRRGLRLMDSAGHVLPMGAPDMTRFTSTTDITVDFTRGIGKFQQGPPAKILWDVPETRKVIAPFTFKNLPIDGGF
jgi:hypothetical protein